MNFKTSIGIEIHLELNTKTKIFSPAPNIYDAKPNTLVHPIDLGYPGTLPNLNKQVVIKALQLAKALNMDITNTLLFDRKHYFYPDLPKGYQITQFRQPIATNGYITLRSGKKIHIKQIHLEEDTAKSIYKDQKWLLDFNRSGIPLIEIVTQPDIKDEQELKEFLETFRLIAIYLNISDAKMENGSLRVDINISCSTTEILGTKVEIKNLNSISNSILAIQQEKHIQINNLQNNEPIRSVSKKFNDQIQKLEYMRDKNKEIEYKYLPEFNIPPIKLNKTFLDQIFIPLLPWEKENFYLSKNIPIEYVKQLIKSFDKMAWFDQLKYHDLQKAANVFFKEIVSYANKNNKTINELKINPKDIDQLLFKKTPLSLWKQIIPLLENNNQNIDQLLKINNLEIFDNVSQIEKIIEKLFIENQEFIEQNQHRLDKVKKMIFGQVMKQTKGLSNPQTISKIIDKKIK